MQEYRRLSHLGLLQVIFRTFKHEVGDAEAEHLIGFLKHVMGEAAALVEVFAHTHKLGTLTREYKCFHTNMMFNY